jgi:hypothetical protein
LRRRPRPKLGCGAKEIIRRKEDLDNLHRFKCLLGYKKMSTLKSLNN